MSKEAMEQFREAINGNKEWQEEVRNFGENDDMVSYAKGKGYEFSTEEYKEYREKDMVEELSDFELESVAGGKGAMGGLGGRSYSSSDGGQTWTEDDDGGGIF
jgi:predicted ribosomally synthesized peptide with nif11-like leader